MARAWQPFWRRWQRRRPVKTVFPTPVSVPVMKMMRALMSVSLGPPCQNAATAESWAAHTAPESFPIETQDFDVARIGDTEDGDELALVAADLGAPLPPAGPASH